MKAATIIDLSEGIYRRMPGVNIKNKTPIQARMIRFITLYNIEGKS
jgi:hypothetical protein